MPWLEVHRLQRGFGFGWCRWLVGVLCLAAVSAWAQSAGSFRAPPGAADIALGTEWLSPTEREFLAQLPVVRVGLARAGAPPYEEVSPSFEVGGIQADLLGAVARTLGLKLEAVVFESWPQVLEALRDKRIDMILTVGMTPERQRYMAYTLGTVPLPVAVFVRSGDRRPLEAATFALEAGLASNELVARRFPKARVQNVETTRQALARVADGSADAFVGPVLELAVHLRRHPQPGIEMREFLQAGSGHYHFGVRPDWAPLVPVVNRVLTGLRGHTLPALQSAVGALPASSRWPRTLALLPAEQRAIEQRPVWRIGAVRGLALLNDVDREGRHSGIAADYAEWVAAQLGIGTEIVPFDSVADMLEALRGGRIDLVPLLTKTPERSREFVFSQPYFEMPYMLLARNDAPMYWDLASLAGRRLALAAAHPLRPLVASRHPTVEIVDAANGQQAMDMVADGRADAAVEIKVFANLRVNGDPAAGLRVLGPVGELPAQFHFAVRPDRQALVALVDRTIEALPADERERMGRRWVAVDLQPPFPWRRWAGIGGAVLAALLLLAGTTAYWLRRLSREVQARRVAQEQFEDIARVSPSVLFRYRLDDAGQLLSTWHSPSAAAFLGLAPRDGLTLLEQLGDRVAPHDLERAQAEQRRVLASGQPYGASWLYHHPDGRDLRMRVDAVRSRGADGLAVWTGVVTDITPEQQLREQLAQEADQRYALLAAASHELRAPVHTLALALQSLPEDSGGVPEATPTGAAAGTAPSRKRALAIARDAARTLGALLDELLDAARVGAGRVEIRPQDTGLAALLDGVADAWRAAAAERGLGFDDRRDPRLPALLRVDPLRLKQLLDNLLSNALKYTVAGHLSLAARVAGEGSLELEVADTGRGIPAEQQRRLFEPFAAGEAGPGVRSTGLGLWVCRRLVELMGGRIELSSEPGRGTRVRVRLPLVSVAAGAAAPAAAPVAAAPAMPRPAGGALLVCDDDPVCRMLLAQWLANRGHEVVECGDARSALHRWRQGGVAAVVTDLNMPGDDGRWLVKALREAEATSPAPAGGRTPVIVCSGDPPPDPAPAAVPWDAYAIKPLDLGVLAALLQRLRLEPAKP
jgi:two-component system sensor histidine kinase EvgS